MASEYRFAVTRGDAATAGGDLLRRAMAAGFNKHSVVHGLVDGAIWIEDRMERQSGAPYPNHVIQKRLKLSGAW